MDLRNTIVYIENQSLGTFFFPMCNRTRKRFVSVDKRRHECGSFVKKCKTRLGTVFDCTSSCKRVVSLERVNPCLHVCTIRLHFVYVRRVGTLSSRLLTCFIFHCDSTKQNNSCDWSGICLVSGFESSNYSGMFPFRLVFNSTVHLSNNVLNSFNLLM